MANDEDEQQRSFWTKRWQEMGATHPTANAPSVSGPSRPSKPKPSVQYSESRLGDVKTVTDGKTAVKYSPERDFSNARRNAYFHENGKFPPCINTDCSSYGMPHPNCLCYGSGSMEFAKGGSVSESLCDAVRPHKSECQYAKGGEIQQPQFIDNPQETLDHAAAHHGLLGLLKNVGKAKFSDSNRHAKHFETAKLHMSNNDHEKASDFLSGHPLVGGVGKQALKPILERLSHSLISQEPNHEAMRGSVDYLSASMKGRDKLKSHMKGLVGNSKFEKISHDEKAREELKNHLDVLRSNPEELLETGGDIGHYLPNHGAQLGALTGAALSHLDSFKPHQAKNSPLDDPSPVDKGEEQKYNRHLDIAQNPMLVLQHVKDGSLLPSDILTLKTLYPSLHKSMAEQAMEAVIEAQSKGVEIPYKQRISLSTLIGQPLDSTMTIQSMQAIMSSAAPQQAQNQAKKESKKATGVELKQINKVNEMYPTALQQRQIDKRD